MQDITSHFCPNCGTTLYRTGGSPQVAGLVGLRSGCLDDQTAIRENAPTVEVYVDKRAAWKAPLQDAAWLDSKYEVLKGPKQADS